MHTNFQDLIPQRVLFSIKEIADSAYYAAKSYVALAKTDDAKKYYKYIVDDYSTSGYYKEASDYVNSH
jgi:hypothetical protein